MHFAHSNVRLSTGIAAGDPVIRKADIYGWHLSGSLHSSTYYVAMSGD